MYSSRCRQCESRQCSTLNARHSARMPENHSFLYCDEIGVQVLLPNDILQLGIKGRNNLKQAVQRHGLVLVFRLSGATSSLMSERLSSYLEARLRLHSLMAVSYLDFSSVAVRLERRATPHCYCRYSNICHCPMRTVCDSMLAGGITITESASGARS